jgi:glycosyltransferase involved in cell wall biosynthesis
MTDAILPEPIKRDDSRLKIVAFRGDRAACFFYRLSAPLSYVAKNNPTWDITITGVLDTRKLADYNIAIMQRQYRSDVFYPLLAMKKNGTKIIYEIDDDLFNVPKWNPAYETLGKKAVQDNIKYFLSNVHAIFTTTEHLKSVYSQYCANIFVLPNSIDYEVLHKTPANSAKKVVTWQGSQTHDRDMSLIVPALKEVVKRKDAFLKLWQIDVGIPEAYQVPYVPFAAFYQMFSQLDGYVGLAPLTTVFFNKSKSNLKWLEYTAHGMATIASRVGPYADSIEHEKTGLLIEDNHDWLDAINYLLDNPEKHAELVKNAAAVVKEKYDISKNYVVWEDALKAVLKL